MPPVVTVGEPAAHARRLTLKRPEQPAGAGGALQEKRPAEFVD